MESDFSTIPVDSMLLSLGQGNLVMTCWFGLIIVGNPKVLCKNNLWAQLLNDYKDKDLLVEGRVFWNKGPINNLRPSSIILNKPVKLLPKPNVEQNREAELIKETIEENNDEKIHDICNLLLPVPAEKLCENSKTCSIPLQVILPPLAEPDLLKTAEEEVQESPPAVEEVDDEQHKQKDALKNDILSFAKNFASFNLNTLISDECRNLSNEDPSPSSNEWYLKL